MNPVVFQYVRGGRYEDDELRRYPVIRQAWFRSVCLRAGVPLGALSIDDILPESA